MALKLSVKIGDVTNLSDARYAAGMGVDYIGFNIDSNSKHFVTPETFSEIVNWISGVGIIGEVGAEMPENEKDFGSFLTETTNTTLAQSLNECVLRFDTSTLGLQDIRSQINLNPNVAFYVLELAPEEITTDEQKIIELCSNYPIYLSTDFSQELLEKVVNQIKPKGIEIKGGLEDQPGFKDYDGIADVLEWLEID